MSILSMLGIDEKETEVLALKAELVSALRDKVRLSEIVIELIKQRDALQEKLRRRGVA